MEENSITGVVSYVETQKALLQIERDEEKREAVDAGANIPGNILEAAGIGVAGLAIHSTFSDVGGRQVVQFRTRGAREITAARISNGDIVEIRSQGRRSAEAGSTEVPESKKIVTNCVVVSVYERGIDVACENSLEDENEISPTYIVIKIRSNVTYERCIRGLNLLQNVYDDTTHASYGLVKTLFNNAAPRFDPKVKLSEEERRAMMNLNEDQKEAVLLALSAKDLAVIHGPPGTGKTHTLVSYIVTEVLRGSRVLVAAPSNVAIDNIAERLANEKKVRRFVRMGHPARIIPTVSPFSMESQILKTDEAQLAQDIRSELDALERKCMKTRDKIARKSLRVEQRQLRKDLRVRENRAVRELLNNVDVVLATISGTGTHSLDLAESIREFDVVIIDEAAQALEASCWIALLRAKKAVLAGDPHQLGGTVKSKKAEAEGLKQSILDRVFKTPQLKPVISMLRTQYRMHESISKWTSDEFYQGELTPDNSVSKHMVTSLESWNSKLEDEESIVHPFTLIDTAGGDCEEGGPEIDEKSSTLRKQLGLADIHASRHNKGEAEITERVVSQFVQSGVPEKDIGVISPYSGQVELLRRMLRPKFNHALEISTIDSFQGREKEVICISLVRSNEKGDVGFLADERRLNVAITRARRCVTLICDSETVSSHPFLSRIIEYAEEYGDYRSAVVDFSEIIGTISHQRRPVEAIEAEKKNSRAPKKSKGKKKDNQLKTVPLVSQNAASTIFKDVQSRTYLENTPKTDSDLLLQVNEFMADENLHQKIFPPTLSSMERKIVHEIAEQFNLRHESIGEGNDRHIELSKTRKMMKNDPPISSGGQSSTDHSYRESGANILNQERTIFTQIMNKTADDGSESDKSHSNDDGNDLGKPISQLDMNDRTEGEASSSKQSEVSDPSTGTGSKSKRGKRRKQRKREDSDDFDAILAQYGGPTDPTMIRNVTGPAGRIVNGVLTREVKQQPKNTRTRNKLAQKLAEKADQRKKKTKKQENE